MHVRGLLLLSLLLGVPGLEAQAAEALAVQIREPLHGATVTAGTRVWIEATTTGGEGAVTVALTVVNPSGMAFTCEPDPSTGYRCRWGVPTVRGIIYTLTAEARDAAGQVATSPPVFVIAR